jgi:hypothetical protein
MRHFIENILRTGGDADLTGDAALMTDKLDHDANALGSARCSVCHSVRHAVSWRGQT